MLRRRLTTSGRNLPAYGEARQRRFPKSWSRPIHRAQPKRRPSAILRNRSVGLTDRWGWLIDMAACPLFRRSSMNKTTQSAGPSHPCNKVSQRRSKSGRLLAPVAFNLLAGTVVLAAPRSVEAQSIDHHVQLSLNANLLAYDSLKLSGTSSSATDTTWGPGASGLGLGLGYGLTDNWLLGVQLLGSSTTSSSGGSGATDLKLMSYSVLPRLEYSFEGEPSLRPYVGLTLGLRGSSTSDAGSNASATDFVFGGAAGLRVFAAPGFSIDPSVTLLGSTGKEDFGGATLDRSGFTFLFGVALSGWMDVSVPQVAPTPGSAPAPTPSTSAIKAQPAINALGKPEATLDTDNDGTMRAEVVLGDQRRVRLVGRPIHDGHAVLVELIGASDMFGQCVELRVLVDGNEHATRSTPRPVAGASNALQVLVAPTLIESIGNAEHSASLVTCGTDWVISGGARSVVRQFFERFRESAERYGLWNSNRRAGGAERQTAEAR